MPTTATLHAKLREDNPDFPNLSTEWLRKLLLKMNFRYTRRNDKLILYEQPRIISQRRKYLREIQKYRNEGDYIIYQDETWVNSHCSPQKCWLEVHPNRYSLCDLNGGLRVPSGAGQRLIINHIGGEKCFVAKVSDVFISNTREYRLSYIHERKSFYGLV